MDLLAIMMLVFFDDKDEDGQIMTELQTDDPEELEVRQRLWYYLFGMQMDGIVADTTEPHHAYRHNGKELDGVSQIYEYGARYFDPTIGKFTGVDPLADMYSGWSPYNYVKGNPILHTDPTGRSVDGEYERDEDGN